MSSFFALLSLFLLFFSPHSAADVPLCKLAERGQTGSAPAAAPSSSTNGFPTVTYALSSADTIDYIDAAEVRAALAKAFRQWAQVIPVEFVEAADYDRAFVKVGFYPRLADAYETGRDGSGGVAVRMSATRQWVADDAESEWRFDALDLETAFLQAIGRLLGLPLAKCEVPVMCRASLPPRTRKFLTAGDVHDAQDVCGSNPNFDARLLPVSHSDDDVGIWILLALLLGLILATFIWCCIRGAQREENLQLGN